MTGHRLKIGFALGAALAGMLAAALRVTGLSDPATAVADERPPPAAARPAPKRPAATSPATPPPSTPAAPAAEPEPEPAQPMTPEAAERWRAKPAAQPEVTARVVRRAASGPAAERGAETACPPERGAAARAPGGDDTGQGTAPCGRKTEAIEIDWHAPAATP